MNYPSAICTSVSLPNSPATSPPSASATPLTNAPTVSIIVAPGSAASVPRSSSSVPLPVDHSIIESSLASTTDFHDFPSTDAEKSFDSAINILTNGKVEQSFKPILNPPIHKPRQNGATRPRQQRTLSKEMAAALEANPTLRIVFGIILGYFKSYATSFKIANLLCNLGQNDSTTVNSLIKATSSINRPETSSQLNMINQLSASNIFTISKPRQNVVQLKKNPNYRPL